METKQRKKIALIIFLLTFGVVVGSGFIILAVKGVNPIKAIDEIRYINISSKREAEAYNLYRDVANFQVSLDTVFDETDFAKRAENSTKLLIECQELINRTDSLIKEYNKTLIDLNVNDELGDLAVKNYETDLNLLSELNRTKDFLEVDVEVSKYLLAKKMVIDCYSTISATKDFDNAIASYNLCYAQNSKIEVPFSNTLQISTQYQKTVANYLQKNVELYQALKAKKPDLADSLNSQIKSMISQMSAENDQSNQEIATFLYGEYYKSLSSE